MPTFKYSLVTYLAGSLALASGTFSQYATTNGVNFEVNGQTFNYAGTNVYDAAFQTTAYAQDVVKAAQADGYRVLRCWAFNEYDTANGPAPAAYFQSWANGVPTVNTGDNGLALLDAVVSQAESSDMKLILSLVNNWDDYGGMDVYVNNTVNRGAYHDLFYTNTQIQAYYTTYVNAVVSRYSNSSAIFAWELTNEARCAGTGPNPQSPDGCSPSVITSWADQMSTHIKTIDPNHMVSFGGEGFFNRPSTANDQFEYDGASGQDFDALIALKNIDFGTMHLYISSTSGYENVAWSLQWLEDHDNSSVSANKPVIQEEYGVGRDDTTYNRQNVYDQWHNYIFSSEAINGDMTWGSLVVDSDCPGSDIYAICSTDADYGDIVTNWVTQMNGKS